MRKPRNFSWIMKTTRRAVSVNQSYRASIKNGHAVMYKTKECKDYIKELQDQMDYLETPEWIHDKKMAFKMYVKVLVREGFFQRDLDNTLKAIQDAIARSPKFGFNDSRIVHITCEKQIIPGSPHETIVVNLEESLMDPIFSNLQELPRPLGIFLGGTCAGDPWRKTIEPWLEEHRYDYYDPVVPDWTPDCIQAENNFKENKMDCFLALLTPKMKGVYSIAEIMNEIMEVRDNGYGSVLLGILGSKDDWGEGMWRSLNATVDLINGISQGSKQIVASFISDPLDICQYLDQNGWKGKRKPKQ